MPTDATTAHCHARTPTSFSPPPSHNFYVGTIRRLPGSCCGALPCLPARGVGGVTSTPSPLPPSRPPGTMGGSGRHAPPPPPPTQRMATDFVLGGAAAAVAKSGAAPIERVKLLLQNQGEMINRGRLSRPYVGIGDCALRVLREEGVRAFWRGNQANVIRYFPTQAINFSLKGYFQNFYGCSKEKDGHLKWLACNVASGSMAGAISSLLLYHLDFARTRLATDAMEAQANNLRQYRGLLDVYRKTLSTDGLPGLYRGFSVSVTGITLYRGMYFGIYDTMKPVVLVGPLQGSFIASFFLGWSVTTFSGICAYPFDTIRRRMMMTSGQPSKYTNGWHALRMIVQREGYRALFRGVTANMLSGIAGAGVLSGYDQLTRFAGSYGYNFGGRQLTGGLK